MNNEEGWKMYIDIKYLKDKGFSNTAISEITGLSRPTVTKYLNMTGEEFQIELENHKSRNKKADKYKKEILNWIKEYPKISAAQIYDWLEEKYKTLDFKENTLRMYVRKLRNDYDIPKEKNHRQYEAVEDPPLGKQMQVDFGQKKIFNEKGEEIKLHVMCFVLSHSRYKYCKWSERPFTTRDIIKIHEEAFEYFGGYPDEAVYDQDHLILVSENHGELIYTKEFAGYIQKRRFKIRMCRKADPESKGRVEKVVDFVKDNYASNRIFYNIDMWNENCFKWLSRRANGKVHGTTKKIPEEVFLEEKKLLNPIIDKIISKTNTISITYQVRKDNTVPVKGNRYTVPTGTYNGPSTYVKISKINNKLIILNLDTNEEIARHEIPSSKGNLVRNTNHQRNKSAKINKYIENVVSKFDDKDKIYDFIEIIRKSRPRYIRDNLTIIDNTIKNNPSETVDKALNYCIKYNLYSGIDLRDAVNHYSKKIIDNNVEVTDKISNLKLANRSCAKAKVRDISKYIEIMSKSNKNQT